MEVVRYSSSWEDKWNRFVAASRNSTFLFMRGYMDYHADRFNDHSLVFLKNNRIVALLPAELSSDSVLSSHSGLTYGGLLLPRKHINGSDVRDMFASLADHCLSKGIKSLIYKPLPFIYAEYPSQEDICALANMGAALIRCDLSSALSPASSPGMNSLMKRHLKKALSLDPVIIEHDDPSMFWDMLALCLHDRHGALPVHSKQELIQLKNRFPDNIRIFTISASDVPEAGVCVYDTGTVAHCQYIATTESGREKNLLTPLFNHLISNIFSNKRYFDFGTSNEDDGRIINDGLLRQKFSYGATGVAYPRFRLDF